MRQAASPEQNKPVLFFRNFAYSTRAAILWHMAEELNSMAVVVSGNENKVVDRPFRVKLRGSVLALVRLPNRRSVRAAFHQLSTSGGIIHLEKPLDEKLDVELIFHIGEDTIRGQAQMLFPMWATQGWMQPFRFVDLSDANRKILDANLKSFLGEAAKAAGSGSATV
jgi:hypothetical protein